MTISVHKCGYCGEDYGVIGDKRFMCRCQKGEYIVWMCAIALIVIVVVWFGLRVFVSPSPAEMQKDIAGLSNAQKVEIMAYPGRLP